MKWIKANERLPLNGHHYVKVIRKTDNEIDKCMSLFINGVWREENEYWDVLEWLDESDLPNEPSIDEITRLQNIGITLSNDIEQKRKEIESLKQELNEPSIQEEEEEKYPCLICGKMNASRYREVCNKCMTK